MILMAETPRIYTYVLDTYYLMEIYIHKSEFMCKITRN